VPTLTSFHAEKNKTRFRSRQPAAWGGSCFLGGIYAFFSRQPVPTPLGSRGSSVFDRDGLRKYGVSVADPFPLSSGAEKAKPPSEDGGHGVGSIAGCVVRSIAEHALSGPEGAERGLCSQLSPQEELLGAGPCRRQWFHGRPL